MPASSSRRAAVTLAALVGSLGIASCATVTERDVVARVGDVRLDREGFDALLTATTGDADGPVPVDRQNVTGILNGWIITEILAAEVERAGVTLTTTDFDLARQELEAQFGQEWSLTTPALLRDLQIRQVASITAWEAIEAGPDLAEDLERAYPLGPERSSLTCSAHILVASVDEADALLDALDDGADFATLARENSLDSGSAPGGGFLGCQGTPEFTSSIVPEFADAVLDGSVGEIIGPVRTEFGYHVIWIPPLDGLDGEVRRSLDALATDPQIRFRLAATAADVSLDPRYGVFDPNAGVTVLG